MQLDVTFPNLKKIREELKKTEQEAQNAVQKAIKDTANRAPAQVTKAVTAVYGIKASEVTAAGGAAKRGKKTVGQIKVSGITADTIHIVYSGRPLTLTHFGMTPKQRPEGNRKYTVKAAVMKGLKVAYEGAFVQTARNATIAFEREGKARYPISAIKRTSIPQMIESENVEADIRQKLDDVLQDRIAHYTERALQK